MDNSETNKSSAVKSKQIIHVALQLLSLAFLLGWCFQILAPFINPILWGAILAVSLYPMHKRLKKLLKGRGVLAAVLITATIFILLLVIGTWLGIKTGSEIKTEVSNYKEGKIKIPAPPASVKGWPLIGEKAYQFWEQLTSGVDNIVQKYPDEVKSATSYFLQLLATAGKAFLIFAVSILICGVFLSYGNESAAFAHNVFNRLINSTKFDMATIAAITIRNVVRGILGVSVIQSLCAGIGFLAAGIPYAGIWTLLCLVLAIIQIGIFPIVLGVLIYIWTTDHTTTAILLTIWMIPVGLLDNILKPLMMGKGAPVPMLIIFLGSLGGFIYSGIVGLFTGSVILSLGYRLFDVWLKEVEL
ncbi:MAG TPA: AI-2E family transporter [Puia sp.]|jgi:predicted PurR-regulated permease PerM|nr:AI-2E family transporter [Puia sp.]